MSIWMKFKYFGRLVPYFLFFYIFIIIFYIVYYHDIIHWTFDPSVENQKTLMFYHNLVDWIAFILSIILLYGFYKIYVHGQKKSFFKINKDKLNYRLLLKIFLTASLFVLLAKTLFWFDLNLFITSKFRTINFHIFTNYSYWNDSPYHVVNGFWYWRPLFDITFETIIVPIIEEIFFRGIIFNVMLNNKYVNEKNYKKMSIITICVSSILFSLHHIEDFNYNIITSQTYYLSMSFYFSYLYNKTKNIRYTMFFHISLNSLLTLLILLFHFN